MYDATTATDSNAEVIKEHYTEKYTFKEIF
jgi:hypothetical protein